jgi:uncharacterized protein YjbJ (UPF0337 family)
VRSARRDQAPARMRAFLFGLEDKAYMVGTSSPAERCRNEQRLEETMDWNRVEGNWKQTKGKIKEKWGQLTDDDLTQIDGRRDQLEGKIQERYGLAKDRARKDVEDWLSTIN